MLKSLRLPLDDVFRSEQIGKDLARKSVHGGMTTMGSQACLFMLNTARTIILARLLTPADFGLVGMVMVIVNFAAMFKDAGLSMATVQKSDITEAQISTLFWINTVVSLALSIVVMASAPLVAVFYQRPDLAWVTIALSVPVFFQGLTIQHHALLRRHMRFAALAVEGVGSQIVALLVSVVLALHGWRHWSLVAGSMAGTAAAAAVTFFMCPWVPRRPRRRTGIRSMLCFGAHITGFEFINFFSRNLDNLLIGKFVGDHGLGLYSKAYQIVYLPINNVRSPINSVAFPVLSSLRDDPVRFRKYYGHIVFMMAFLTMPIMAFCFTFPGELIGFVFGERWMDMQTAFRLLAIAGFPAAVSGTRGIVLLACKQSALYLMLGVVGAVLFAAGFLIGVRWGIEGVACGFLAATYLPQYHFFRTTFQRTPCAFRDLLSNTLPVALFCLLAMGISHVVLQRINGTYFTRTLLAGGISIPVYALFCLVHMDTRRKLGEALRLLPRKTDRESRS